MKINILWRVLVAKVLHPLALAIDGLIEFLHYFLGQYGWLAIGLLVSYPNERKSEREEIRN